MLVIVSKRAVVCAGIVVVGPDGRLVLTFKSKSGASLPKGHVDPGETLEQAAIRETREEAGIADVEILCKLFTLERQGSNGELKRITIFLGTTDETDLNPTDSKHTAKWLGFDGLYLRLRADRPADAKELIKHRRPIEAVQARVAAAQLQRSGQELAV
jgi:8-oxo-dGTP pyrophosphatase MutT (NUDIX family)